jgi:hypothetical protein
MNQQAISPSAIIWKFEHLSQHLPIILKNSN